MAAGVERDPLPSNESSQLRSGGLIRHLKQSLRRRAFAVVVRLLAKALQAGPECPLLVVCDCYGRLANRLTVLANLVAHQAERGGIILDLAYRKQMKSDWFAPETKIGGGLFFGSLSHGQRLLATPLIACLVRWHKAVASTVDDPSIDSLHGLKLLNAHKQPRDLAFDRGVLGPPIQLLTGIFFQHRQPGSSARRVICGQLRATTSDRKLACSVLRNARRSTRVGVHIRHGDYRTWKDGRFFHDRNDYVQCMMLLSRTLLGDVSFYVVSDEEQDFSQVDAALDITCVRGSESEDLALLSECDFIIATHSSFANWASFVGQVPLLTVRDGLRLVVHRQTPRIDQIPVVPFPRLQGDYLVRYPADNSQVLPRQSA